MSTAKVIDITAFKKIKISKKEKDASTAIRKHIIDKKSRTEKELAGIVSIFDREIKKRKKKLKAKNSTLVDLHGNREVLEAMLKMTLSVIPIAEKAYKKWPTQTNAYAANALISQSREVMNELRSMTDNSQTTDFMLKQIFLPALQLILQHLLTEFTNLKRELVVSLPQNKRKKMKKYLNNLLTNHGELLEQVAAQVQEQVYKYYA